MSDEIEMPVTGPVLAYPSGAITTSVGVCR